MAPNEVFVGGWVVRVLHPPTDPAVVKSAVHFCGLGAEVSELCVLILWLLLQKRERAGGGERGLRT